MILDKLKKKIESDINDWNSNLLKGFSIKPYKNLILGFMGVTLDSWDRVEKIDKNGYLYREVESKINIKEAANKLADAAYKDYMDTFESRKVKIKKALINKINEEIDKSIVEEVFDAIKDKRYLAHKRLLEESKEYKELQMELLMEE